MDDVIYRQAAIDAIKEFQHGAAEWREEQEELSDIWHRADSAIASAIEIGLRVKKIPSAQQWTPCKKKLPDDSELKWVTYLNGPRKERSIAFYSTEEQEWCEPTRGYSFFYPIIAWMPLVHPEPYKGE